MSVAVTGASGFIGSTLVRSLQADGRTTIDLGRRPAPGSTEHRPFVLGERLAAGSFEGVDTLVHCAHDLRATTPADIYERNVAGSIALLERARTEGVRRIVHISSMSAYPGTHQLYGRSKLEVERTVSALGGVSLRLGLVYDERAEGMVGALRRLTGLPVIPLLGRGSYQYVVQTSDAIAAVRLAVDDPTLTGPIGVAHPERVPLRALLAHIAAAAGRAPRLVTLPWRAAYVPMRVAEALRVPLPFRADSLLGLVRPAPEVVRWQEWPRRGLALSPLR